jgi:hypothetical protein
MKRRWLVLGSTLLLSGGVGMFAWRTSQPGGKDVVRPRAPEAARRSVGSAYAAAPLDEQVRERSKRVVQETLRRAPDRLSTTARLPPFDQAAFEADPSDYLSRIEPARCFQTLRAGPNAPALEAKSSLREAVTTRQELPLFVKVPPNAPVTFTSFGGGAFRETAVSTATVRADARGLASVRFVAADGVGGDVAIVAGSPLASGNLRFLLRVEPAPI